MTRRSRSPGALALPAPPQPASSDAVTAVAASEMMRSRRSMACPFGRCGIARGCLRPYGRRRVRQEANANARSFVATDAFQWEDLAGLPARLGWSGLIVSVPIGRPWLVSRPWTSDRSVARLHEGFNDRDLDAWSEVFDEDVELVVDGAAFRGVAAARAYVTAVFREFPGLRIHGARVVAERGDTIVVEHQILNGDPSRGPLRPQGSVCEIYRVRDGRVVAYRSYYAAEQADREDVVNVPSRAEGSKMAEEQAALRRVATLVARGVSPGSCSRRSPRRSAGSWAPSRRPWAASSPTTR